MRRAKGISHHQGSLLLKVGLVWLDLPQNTRDWGVAAAWASLTLGRTVGRVSTLSLPGSTIGEVWVATVFL